MNLTPLEPAGRTALVTGGGTGIGRATARALARAGARVALTGRRPEPLDHVTAQIIADGGEAFAVPCDLTHERQARTLLDLVRAAHGEVDILVNNAGAAFSAPIGRTEDADLDRLMDVNVRVPWLLTSLLLTGMRERDFGRVVNVASVAALRGCEYTTLYTMTKHALGGLTRSCAMDVRGTGVTVNAVCPGFVDTSIVSEAAERIAQKTGRETEEARETLAAMNPLGRLVTPDEVAAAILYLVGPGSAAVSGAFLIVDGGTFTT